MKFQKNLPAKIAAIVASIGALALTWGLVRQNPPAPAAADNVGSTASSPAAAPATATAPAERAANSAPAPVQRRHVTTHVS